MEAWRHKYPDYSITLFVDRGSRLEVPFPAPGDLDDKLIMEHLYHFYGFTRFRKGLIHSLLPKTLARVDIIEVSADSETAGKHTLTVLLF
jgi:hypothetical protein